MMLSYLAVGSVAVRVLFSASENYAIKLPNFARLVTAVELPIEEMTLSAPELAFSEISPAEEPKRIVKVAEPKVVEQKIAETVIVEEDILQLAVEQLVAVHESELPFQETISLKPVYMKEELETNLLASYQEFEFKESLVAETPSEPVVRDEVSTEQASLVDAEPEFFEYEAPVEEVAVAAKATTPAETDVITNDLKNDYSKNPATNAALKPKQKTDVASTLNTQTVLSSVGYSNQAPTTPQLAFDYSKATKDINQAKRTVAQNKPGVNSQKGSPYKSAQKSNMPNSKVSYSMGIEIRANGTDMKRFEDVNGFEIRFQDDQSESFADYGSGRVQIEEVLSQPKMTRSLVILKRGYIPTNSDVILEEGDRVVSIPLIEEDAFNKMTHPFQGKFPVGALLVELDDEAELAQIDVPFGKVITLDGNFKKTKKNDFRYQLFVGVKAGNALITYRKFDGESVSRIIHVHEHELTFEANYFERTLDGKVRLFENDLLGKESSPLIVSTESVKAFMKDASAKKINSHTYKMNFGTGHLGGRRYVELLHQSEPIFMGLRENINLQVPSESFMRHVLSRFEDAKLGNRCLVQINLAKKAMDVKVGAESVASSLMMQTQMLDSDGKFYDSLSEKTEKVMIVGESHASGNISSDAKINVKITHEDGTVHYLSSYCSPNTYLVEQL